MLDSLKALRAAINVGVFPGAVESRAKDLVDNLSTELEAEQYDEGVEVQTATEQLQAELTAVAASFDEEDDDVSDDEDETP